MDSRYDSHPIRFPSSHSRLQGLVQLLPALSVLLLVGCSDRPTSSRQLPQTDEEAVRRVEQAYVQGWEANDREAVMATLATDAVIIPAGMEPIREESAIRAYWWPRDGSETRVTSYETTLDEVGGAGDFAFARGTGHLEFHWREADDRAWQSVTSRSVWLTLLRRRRDGTWRMTHRMWHPVGGQ